MARTPLRTHAITAARSNATERAASRRPSRRATITALLVADVAAAVLAVAAAVAAARWLGLDAQRDALALTVAFVALAPAAFRLARLYPGIGVTDAGELGRLSVATGGVWAALLPALAITGGRDGVGLGLLSMAVALLAVPSLRWVLRDAASVLPWWGVPVVLLGAGRRASGIVRDLDDRPRRLLRPVAAFDDDPDLHGGSVDGVPVLGRLADAVSLADEGIRHALVTEYEGTTAEIRERIDVQALRFPSLIVLTGSARPTVSGAGVLSIGRGYGVELRQPRLLARNLFYKRLLDLVLLVPAGLVAIPIVGVAALVVRAVNYGNPFYTQERVGLNGQRFQVIKLRTMYLDAEERLARYLDENPEAREEWRRSYKLRHDTRILPGIGHFLRSTSLDELPQLWNIARGEMSFVGPRPFPPYHLDAFGSEFRQVRQQVMPGLTGLWQISARSDSDLEIQERLDRYYIDTWSLGADLAILARTPAAVLSRRGAH